LVILPQKPPREDAPQRHTYLINITLGLLSFESAYSRKAILTGSVISVIEQPGMTNPYHCIFTTKMATTEIITYQTSPFYALTATTNPKPTRNLMKRTITTKERGGA
jgi:hypothetical protein